VAPDCDLGPTAAAWAEHLDVGRQVLVRGRLRTRSWTDRQGVQRWSTEVLAGRVIFLGGAAKRATEPAEQVEPPPPEDPPAGADDVIPF
jgi:single-strand DNA-binding protein